MVEEERVVRALHGRVQVRIRAHDARRLAAQLQRHRHLAQGCRRCQGALEQHAQHEHPGLAEVLTIFLAACCMMSLPTSVLPVNAT